MSMPVITGMSMITMVMATVTTATILLTLMSIGE